MASHTSPSDRTGIAVAIERPGMVVQTAVTGVAGHRRFASIRDRAAVRRAHTADGSNGVSITRRTVWTTVPRADRAASQPRNAVSVGTLTAYVSQRSQTW